MGLTTMTRLLTSSKARRMVGESERLPVRIERTQVLGHSEGSNKLKRVPNVPTQHSTMISFSLALSNQSRMTPSWLESCVMSEISSSTAKSCTSRSNSALKQPTLSTSSS